MPVYLKYAMDIFWRFAMQIKIRNGATKHNQITILAGLLFVTNIYLHHLSKRRVKMQRYDND